MEKRIPDFKATDSRDCLACKGSGVYVSTAFTSLEGVAYPEATRVCSSCSGTKVWAAPNYPNIINSLVSTKGKNKGSLRASPPSDPYRTKDKDQWRSYYVWRLARFHGGADVTMPMSASMFCGKDPFIVELDALADWVAKKAFGTNMAAAYRWTNALGGSVPVPATEPATAHAGGPVVDGNKPAWELAELID